VLTKEFYQLYENYKKKYKNQVLFRSVRMVKNSQGGTEPVFYIGVPGLMIALTISAISIFTVFLLYLPFKWYIWVPYVIFVIFAYRIAMKLDKVRQIRYMVYYLLETCVKLVNKSEESEEAEEKKHLIEKAVNSLEKADYYVDEPQIKNQIEILKNIR